ncbi:hypothetical protein TIFTF001_013716 [Ficus carica]|uniref:Uncharacterized protein n=1 Tax=Ficus carica TaxID=3494 RepID=A0AA88A4U5_FICCA|nr:hypothetical protein TIFTF001_013716 [Ficus carica]
MEAIVLYPTTAIGHLIAMVELGKLLLTSKPSLSIHILMTTAPYDAGDTAPYFAAVSASTPSIAFHNNLPLISLPPELSTASAHVENLIFEVLNLSKPNVSQALLFISQTHTIHAFVIDFFCGSTLAVSADDHHIPSYIFFTSAAAALALFLYLPTFHETIPKSLKDLNNNAPLHVPRLPPIPPLDMPKHYLDRHDKAYKYFLESSIHTSRSNGIIVNTFEPLEPRAAKAIETGLCITSHSTPPIYCIGPLILTREKKDSEFECLK